MFLIFIGVQKKIFLRGSPINRVEWEIYRGVRNFIFEGVSDKFLKFMHLSEMKNAKFYSHADK